MAMGLPIDGQAQVRANILTIRKLSKVPRTRRPLKSRQRKESKRKSSLRSKIRNIQIQKCLIPRSSTIAHSEWKKPVATSSYQIRTEKSWGKSERSKQPKKGRSALSNPIWVLRSRSTLLSRRRVPPRKWRRDLPKVITCRRLWKYKRTRSKS